MLDSIQKKIAQVPVMFATELDYQVRLLQHRTQLPQLSPQNQEIVKTLRRDGVYMTSLEELAIPSTQKMLDVAKNLVVTMSDTPTKQGRQYIAVTTAQLLEQPDLYLWGLEERFLNIVENYLAVPSAYCTVTMRRDMADGVQIGPRQWHMDIEDRRILKIIVYLNDVSLDGGPFEYIPKFLTPPARKLKRGGYHPNEAIETLVPPSKWKPCIGKAGTVIFTDTCSVFHHGRVPVSADRYTIFFTYISKQPKNPQYCKPRFSGEQLLTLTKNVSERQKSFVYIDDRDYGKRFAKNY